MGSIKKLLKEFSKWFFIDWQNGYYVDFVKKIWVLVIFGFLPIKFWGLISSNDYILIVIGTSAWVGIAFLLRKHENSSSANFKAGILVIFGFMVFTCIFSYWAQYEKCGPPYNLPPGYHVYISDCEDARIQDISPNGQYLLVYLTEPERYYQVIDLRTDKFSSLPYSSFPTTFINNDYVLLGNNRIYSIRDEIEYDLELVEAIENPNWVSLMEKKDIYYLLHGYTNVVVALSIPVGSGPSYVVRFSNSFPFEFYMPQFDEAGIGYSIRDNLSCHHPCYSHETDHWYVNLRIYDPGHNLINPEFDRLNDLNGWAYDDKRVFGNAFAEYTHTGFWTSSRQIHNSGVLFFSVQDGSTSP